VVHYSPSAPEWRIRPHAFWRPDPFGNLFSLIENPHFKLGDVR